MEFYIEAPEASACRITPGDAVSPSRFLNLVLRDFGWTLFDRELNFVGRVDLKFFMTLEPTKVLSITVSGDSLRGDLSLDFN